MNDALAPATPEAPCPASIRPAVPGDIPDMVGLLGELFAIEADFEPAPARQAEGLRQLLQNPAARVWIAEREGRAIGMIALQILISTAQGGPVGLIEDVTVTQAWRGRGIGAALLAAADAWARDHGLSRLQLLADRANEPALAFYRRAGWHATQLVGWRKLLED